MVSIVSFMMLLKYSKKVSRWNLWRETVEEDDCVSVQKGGRWIRRSGRRIRGSSRG